MCPVVKNVLAKIRMSANLPRSILLASSEEEALGFPNLYDLQRQKKISK